MVQSPQMIQAMQILQLSTLDLQERIEQELGENPFLEVDDGNRSDRDGDELTGESAATEASGETTASESSTDNDATEEAAGMDSVYDALERYEREFSDGSRTRTRASGEDGDRKLEAMQNTPDRFRSLADDLFEQLAIFELSERQASLAEYIVYSLDARGYLSDGLDEIAALCGLVDVTPEEILEVLAMLRHVSHPALGAHDLQECLLLQLDELDFGESLERTLVEDHLENIITNRLPRIARSTGRSIEEVKEALETIRTLDPSPSQGFGSDPISVITPDVVVELVDGEYEVRLVRQRQPDLIVSRSYRKLLEGTKRGDSVQAWVKKRLESARWFIDAVRQRQSTMRMIAEAIFARQREFLDKGVKALAPLRMQEVADECGVHISTVSRAVAGKHAQTPQGIRPLKFFFTGGTAVDSGGVTSQTAIKQRLVELVEQEDHTQPLSDDQLAEELFKSAGIRIARRTVTKYRKALSIPSSTQRKKF